MNLFFMCALLVHFDKYTHQEIVLYTIEMIIKYIIQQTKAIHISCYTRSRYQHNGCVCLLNVFTSSCM